MAQPNSAVTPPDAASHEPLPEALPEPSIGDASWREVVLLLRRAAQLAADHGTESDRFMQAAWAACLDARPGLREELADKELRAQLKKLRKRGLVANA
jgi:hypothetical protein